MDDDVTPKIAWVQKLNFTNKSKEILESFRLFDWRITAYLVLLIYWSVIILGTFPLSN